MGHRKMSAYGEREHNGRYLNGHSMEDTINSQIVKANWLNS